MLRFRDIDVPACCKSLKRVSLLYSATYVAVQNPNYIKATLHEAKILSQPLKSAAEMLLGDEEAGHEAVKAAVEAIAGQCSRLALRNHQSCASSCKDVFEPGFIRLEYYNKSTKRMAIAAIYFRICFWDSPAFPSFLLLLCFSAFPASLCFSRSPPAR